jgi:hypothetical protein
MKVAIVALAVRVENGKPVWVDTLSDGQEVQLFEASVLQGQDDPLKTIYDQRIERTVQDEKFSDYVEDLLSSPFVKFEIQEHGVQWMKSKLRIEKYQCEETEAAKIIAEYAFRLYCKDPTRVDFLLAGPTAQVRVRIFVLGDSSANQCAA